jgi:hypothetical protein
MGFETMERFVIYNEAEQLFAAGDGHSPRYTSAEYPDAFKFETFGQASQANQNFGPEWNVGFHRTWVRGIGVTFGAGINDTTRPS